MTYQPKNLPPCTAELIESGAACVVQDGSGIRVPMTMQDAAPTCGCRAADADIHEARERAQAQREPQSVREANDAMFADYYQRVTAQNAESNARTLTTAAANAAKVQAHADHHAHKDEQHELASLRTANDRAYAASVADLDYRTRRNIA